MPAEHPGAGEWVVVARVLGSRGNRGELKTAPLSGHPDRFLGLSAVYLLGPAGSGARHHRYEVENAWEHRGHIVLKLRGIETISEAERWRGCEVRLPRRERLPLPEGEYYQSDLIGFQVVRKDGRYVGRVRGWQEHGGPALLVVEGESGQELLIPFAVSICVAVDADGRRIVVELPEGLEELNR